MDRKSIQQQFIDWASSELGSELSANDVKSLLDSKMGPSILKLYKLLSDRGVSKKSGDIILSHNLLTEYNHKTNELISKGDRLAHEVAQLCDEVQELNSAISNIANHEWNSELNNSFRAAVSSQVECLTNEQFKTMDVEPAVALLNDSVKEYVQTDSFYSAHLIKEIIANDGNDLGFEPQKPANFERKIINRDTAQDEIAYILNDLMSLNISEKMYNLEDKTSQVSDVKASHETDRNNHKQDRNKAGQKEIKRLMQQINSDSSELEVLLAKVDELKNTFNDSKNHQSSKYIPILEKGVDMIVRISGDESSQ